MKPAHQVRVQIGNNGTYSHDGFYCGQELSRAKILRFAGNGVGYYEFVEFDDVLRPICSSCKSQRIIDIGFTYKCEACGHCQS